MTYWSRIYPQLLSHPVMVKPHYISQTHLSLGPPTSCGVWVSMEIETWKCQLKTQPSCGGFRKWPPLHRLAQDTIMKTCMIRVRELLKLDQSGSTQGNPQIQRVASSTCSVSSSHHLSPLNLKLCGCNPPSLSKIQPTAERCKKRPWQKCHWDAVPTSQNGREC